MLRSPVTHGRGARRRPRSPSRSPTASRKRTSSSWRGVPAPPVCTYAETTVTHVPPPRTDATSASTQRPEPSNPARRRCARRRTAAATARPPRRGRRGSARARRASRSNTDPASAAASWSASARRLQVTTSGPPPSRATPPRRAPPCVAVGTDAETGPRTSIRPRAAANCPLGDRPTAARRSRPASGRICLDVKITATTKEQRRTHGNDHLHPHRRGPDAGHLLLPAGGAGLRVLGRRRRRDP